LDAAGAVLVMTADHGMNAKHDNNEQPDVVYLQSELDHLVGAGVARVILPITDPYVVHHGALGSFATAYLPDGTDLETIAEELSDIDGIAKVYGREEGCAEFELPPERLGDLIVVSDKHKVLGTTPERHDLTQLKEPLRSHGGVSEQRVPLICTKPVSGIDASRRLRNFDAFDIGLNHVAAGTASAAAE
jgi:phosphonoacetate hydrolase